MTLPQFAELAAYWRKYPPLHLLLRSALAGKASPPPAGDLGALLAECAPGGVFMRGR